FRDRRASKGPAVRGGPTTAPFFCIPHRILLLDVLVLSRILCFRLLRTGMASPTVVGPIIAYRVAAARSNGRPPSVRADPRASRPRNPKAHSNAKAHQEGRGRQGVAGSTVFSLYGHYEKHSRHAQRRDEQCDPQR